MKKMNKKLLQTVEYVTRKSVERNIDGRPPLCVGIFHQPKRPVRYKQGNK